MALSEKSQLGGASMSPNYKTAVFRSIKLPLPSSPVEARSSTPPHSSKLPSPLIPSFCFKRAHTPSPKPLLNIEDVRAFIHSKFGSSKEGNGGHSSAKGLPVGLFGLGTMGSSGSDGGYVDLSSPQANEHQGEVSSQSPPQTDQSKSSQSGHGCCGENTPAYQDSQRPYPILDIEDVRDVIDSILVFTGFRRHPTTSWMNKMPWHVPRAPRLAHGLEWPPDSFESEEARQAYYRKARKRKRYLLGAPPLWIVTALNLAFIQLLMYNPLQKFINYLTRLP